MPAATTSVYSAALRALAEAWQESCALADLLECFLTLLRDPTPEALLGPPLTDYPPVGRLRRAL
jgi:hypothetical protein